MFVHENMLQPKFAISPPVFQEFVRCSNKDIEQIIKKEMSGDVKNAMFAIGKIFVSSMIEHQKIKSLINDFVFYVIFNPRGVMST